MSLTISLSTPLEKCIQCYEERILYEIFSDGSKEGYRNSEIACKTLFLLRDFRDHDLRAKPFRDPFGKIEKPVLWLPPHLTFHPEISKMPEEHIAIADKILTEYQFIIKTPQYLIDYFKERNQIRMSRLLHYDTLFLIGWGYGRKYKRTHPENQ